jgi:hypothetical protein
VSPAVNERRKCIRSTMASSANRERGPARQHHVRIRPASARDMTKMRFGFASGITRHEGPVNPERLLWTQECSTNGARLGEGEKMTRSLPRPLGRKES